jgi:hypothetical protein
MAITHSQAAKQAATNAVVDLIDVGAGSNGTMEILDGATVLSVHNLTEPAFGAANASGVATAATIADDASANADGTADGWRLKDEDGAVILTGQAGQKRAITAVSTGSDTVTIAGDHTTEFAAGTDFNITGSTGNDGGYTVASVALDGGNTVITVEADQAIANATADGYVHVGELGLDNTSILTGQTVSVSALTYQALRS